MENIKTAGFWSNLISGIKGFWEKYNDFFDDKQQYKKILQGFKKYGYNANPQKMKMFKEGDKKYLDNNGQIFLVVDASNADLIFSTNSKKIESILNNVSMTYPISDETKQKVKDSFDEYQKKLEVITIDSTLTLVAIK